MPRVSATLHIIAPDPRVAGEIRHELGLSLVEHDPGSRRLRYRTPHGMRGDRASALAGLLDTLALSDSELTSVGAREDVEVRVSVACVVDDTSAPTELAEIDPGLEHNYDVLRIRPIDVGRLGRWGASLDVSAWIHSY